MLRSPQKPLLLDAVLLSIFAVLITLHPYYLRCQINFFELGLYLPGIDGVLKGGIPFRDFFHLRGPMELYVPALLMKIFGEHVAVLSTYFYVGTVLTLILCIFLSKQLFRTRLFFLLLIPVLIGKTFPRVVFTYWGGMRFALGILAMLCAIKYFKTTRFIWMFLAGVAACFGLLTSVEIGVCAFFGVVCALIVSHIFKVQKRKDVYKAAGSFLGGACLIGIPYVIYLVSQQALVPMVDSFYSVVANMENVFDLHHIENTPSNIFEAILAMINPNHDNFKHMTPAYLYLFFGGYLFLRWKKKKLNNKDLALICLAGYGVLMYNKTFRAIGGSQFEMSLQPEKILYFILLEKAFLFFRRKDMLVFHSKEGARLPRIAKPANANWKIYLASFFVFGVVVSSVLYPIQRYNRRFYAFKYVRNLILRKDMKELLPLHDQNMVEINTPRLHSMVVPKWQAEELVQLFDIINAKTKKTEEVFMFPEIGAYNFVVDRPFLGRFPMYTFTWFNDKWHADFDKELRGAPPQVVVVDKDPGDAFPKIYFKVEKNKKRYFDVLGFIKGNYTVIAQTKNFLVYQLN